MTIADGPLAAVRDGAVRDGADRAKRRFRRSSGRVHTSAQSAT